MRSRGRGGKVAWISGPGSSPRSLGAFPVMARRAASNAVAPSIASVGPWLRMCLVGSAMTLLLRGGALDVAPVAGEFGEHALAGGLDLFEQVAVAHLDALEPALAQLAARLVLLRLREQDLGDLHIDEDPREPLGVQHRPGEVALGVPILEERLGPLCDRLVRQRPHL